MKPKTGMLKTQELLLQQYSNRVIIELDEIARPLLGLSNRVAKNRAKAGALPFPVFKINESAKSPYFVHISELAKHIDKCRRLAEKDFIGTN
ncbi:pyocin activator PrtN family protein [Shewanella sp. 1_MG-2023]|uniref:pyocin activator PrtN family protein n=1 Tax=unclassified Shewanella TaxID=196818 RepID=UPI0026E2A231|nr:MULTISPECIES: pyocin activator PrtN family protein [unclassified Shewanella]MDO6613469.1 pyocin activator PrtN family protein [Shewanella sp. 7_MG-2023]MDO6773299.1 pyocin activator PrtN family protein [Shewanella sp. 2_MG-2023]MDO6795950.1 pyocin activator PrtN family protein [Shewanella sp. 1_MG-2023]